MQQIALDILNPSHFPDAETIRAFVGADGDFSTLSTVINGALCIESEEVFPRELVREARHGARQLADDLARLAAAAVAPGPVEVSQGRNFDDDERQGLRRSLTTVNLIGTTDTYTRLLFRYLGDGAGAEWRPEDDDEVAGADEVSAQIGQKPHDEAEEVSAEESQKPEARNGSLALDARIQTVSRRQPIGVAIIPPPEVVTVEDALLWIEGEAEEWLEAIANLIGPVCELDNTTQQIARDLAGIVSNLALRIRTGETGDDAV